MKKHLVLMALAAEALIFCASTALLIRATLAAGNLRQELADTRQRLVAGRQAKLKAEEFEKTREELTRQEQEIRLAVPAAEREPLELIKRLTLLAQEAGAERLSLTLSPRVPVNAGQAARPATAPALSQGQQIGGRATAASVAPSLYAVPIRMDCEIPFPRVIDLLKAVRSLARVITLESADIDRSPGSFPRQQVALTLRCYTLD